MNFGLISACMQSSANMRAVGNSTAAASLTLLSPVSSPGLVTPRLRDQLWQRALPRTGPQAALPLASTAARTSASTPTWFPSTTSTAPAPAVSAPFPLLVTPPQPPSTMIRRRLQLPAKYLALALQLHESLLPGDCEGVSTPLAVPCSPVPVPVPIGNSPAPRELLHSSSSIRSSHDMVRFASPLAVPSPGAHQDDVTSASGSTAAAASASSSASLNTVGAPSTTVAAAAPGPQRCKPSRSRPWGCGGRLGGSWGLRLTAALRQVRLSKHMTTALRKKVTQQGAVAKAMSSHQATAAKKPTWRPAGKAAPRRVATMTARAAWKKVQAAMEAKAAATTAQQQQQQPAKAVVKAAASSSSSSRIPSFMKPTASWLNSGRDQRVKKALRPAAAELLRVNRFR